MVKCDGRNQAVSERKGRRGGRETLERVGRGKSRNHRTKLSVLDNAPNSGEIEFDEAGDEKEGNCKDVDAQTVAEGSEGKLHQRGPGYCGAGR